MDATLYLAFLAATTVMILLPGPSVMLTVAHALRHGWRRALMTVAGATLGVGVQLAITLAGMASFMLVMAQWFEGLRWAGVAYLIYLGLSTWRAKPQGAGADNRDGRSLFLQGLVVTILNPKSLLFMVAFFPQFIDTGASLAQQVSIMVPTFLAITFVFTGLWAVAAGRVGGYFRSGRGARIGNRISGGLMIGAGLGLALARRG